MKRIVYGLILAFFAVGPVQAQYIAPAVTQPPVDPQQNASKNAVMTPVQNAQANPGTNPAPAAVTATTLTSPDSYIWFGNDKINEAAQMVKAKRYVEALAVLDKIIQRDMRLSEAHVLQGICYMQLKDLTKAKQAFNTALVINRAYMGPYIYLADIAVQENNPQQAVVYLQAIKAVCQTEECAEYQFLKNALRTHNVEVN